MKKIALFAAIAAMIAASPAAANGYLGVQYLNGESDLLIGAADSDGWQGEGAFGFGGAGWGGQIGGQFGNVDLDGTGIDIDAWNLAGHLWWNGGGWRLGGVVAHSDADAGGGLSADETAYGLVGTWDAGASAVLLGSVTFGEGDFAGADYDTWNLDVGANFYASPNVRFGGHLGVGEMDFGGGGNGDSMSYGINGEFQPWSAPVSITLGWNKFEIDDFGVEGDMFNIGARWNFGGGTIRDRDNAAPFETRTGAIQRSIGSW